VGDHYDTFVMLTRIGNARLFLLRERNTTIAGEKSNQGNALIDERRMTIGRSSLEPEISEGVYRKKEQRLHDDYYR
jgi:hypothetical protein